MSIPEAVPAPNMPRVDAAPRKRVILTMGGKGGVGETNFILSVAEWLEAAASLVFGMQRFALPRSCAERGRLRSEGRELHIRMLGMQTSD